MKKVLRNIVCGLAAVNLVALAVSCSDGLDDDDPFVKGGVITNPNTGETGGNGNSSGDANATVIFSTETVLDWDMSNTVKIEASKFADATDTSKIVITYVADDNTDYHTFKLMGGEGNENELYAGTAEGFSINTTATNSDDLHGCQFTTAPSTTATNLSYTPTDAEWTKIKTNGFAIIGHGAKVTKVALASSATTNNSAAEPNNGTGTENQQTTGGQTTATVTPYSTTNLTVTTVNNAYSTSTHGIQAKVTVRVGDALKGLSKDDTFVVKMKGTASKAFAPQVYFMDNTSAGGYANLGAWGDTVNFTTEEFDISKEVTISEKAPSSDDADAFVFVIDYDEAGVTADLENVTFNFSEFSVTKK